MRRRFGQHFLEPAWVVRLVEAFGPRPDDEVLEVGPGRGALTRPLASRVSRLVAVEIDRALAGALAACLPANVHVIAGDFLTVDVEALVAGELHPPFRVIGNLPYSVAAPIVFRLLAASAEGRTIGDAWLMLQREVALRLTASPGSRQYGVLAVLVQRLADVSLVLTLPPGAFRPVPKVESAVVRLVFRPPAVRPIDPRLFESLVRGIFAYRRKTVANALRHWARGHDRVVSGVLAAAGLDERRRPETLDLADLARLADLFAAADPGSVL